MRKAKPNPSQLYVKLYLLTVPTVTKLCLAVQ
jgi:hypothetical protein